MGTNEGFCAPRGGSLLFDDVMNLAPLRASILAGLALAAANIPVLAAPLPAEHFTRRPAVFGASLSENGQNLLYFSADEKGHTGLAGVNLQTMSPFAMTLDGDDVSDTRWLTDDSVAFNVAMSRRWSRGLYAYKLGDKFAAGINERDLTDIVSVLRADRTRMYVWYLDGEATRMRGLALLDTDRRKPTGPGRLDEEFMVVRWISAPPGEVLNWIPDKSGLVRLCTTFHKEKKRRWVHAGDTEPWEELPLDWEYVSVEGFSFDGKSLYVVAADAENPTDALRTYDLATKTLGPVIFRDPDFGLEDSYLLWARKDESLAGIRYTRDGATTHWFNERFKKYQAAIDAKLPGRVNHITSWDENETRLIVAAQTDRQPRQYYLFKVETGAISALPAASPWIDPAQMQPMQTVRFKARDGLQLQGYLTLPAKRADGVKPALVVMPHGGPWVRDEWGYDSDVQFLASRGYAVFQPNYRGSSGFKAEVSGERSDFRAMYNDVVDGTELVRKSGLIDPARVAIYGGSFGGYLAMAGAAFEPDRFTCAVSFAGVFDWAKIVDQTRYERDTKFLRYLNKRDLGDPRSDQERFDEISPIKHAAKIKIPVLLVHGKQDRTVEDEQTKDLVGVLKKNKIPHETLFFKDEGHGFNDPENAAKFLKRLEEFLAKNL